MTEINITRNSKRLPFTEDVFNPGDFLWFGDTLYLVICWPDSYVADVFNLTQGYATSLRAHIAADYLKVDKINIFCE